MNTNDAEFLMWLAKRLVYKYGENKEILKIVEIINKKNSLIQGVFQKNTDKIKIDLNNSIQISTELLRSIETNTNFLYKEVSSMKNELTTSRFEDLDMENLLGK